MSNEVVERHLMRVRDVGLAEKYVSVVEAKHYEAKCAEVGEANDLINRLRGYNTDLTKEVNALRAGLEEARGLLKLWLKSLQPHTKDFIDLEKETTQALTNNGGGDGK